ncbi:MAG: hypothetical protein GY716_06780 [bacterium]|nr:hypothetical protein [bacterium]
MSPSPSPNGRDARGRFTPNNAGGPGNPHAAKVGRLRSALLNAVTEDDMAAVAERLVEMARSGDLPAIRELLLRVLGRPLEADLLERIERLEASLGSRAGAA